MREGVSVFPLPERRETAAVWSGAAQPNRSRRLDLPSRAAHIERVAGRKESPAWARALRVLAGAYVVLRT
jgi:hypothetical protein